MTLSLIELMGCSEAKNPETYITDGSLILENGTNIEFSEDHFEGNRYYYLIVQYPDGDLEAFFDGYLPYLNIEKYISISGRHFTNMREIENEEIEYNLGVMGTAQSRFDKFLQIIANEQRIKEILGERYSSARGLRGTRI